MVEILGYNLKSLFENTKLNGICTYKGVPQKEYDITYEVWEVSDEDFDIMCNMTEERFEAYCPDGWWRQSTGSIMGVPCDKFIINNDKIFAWDGYSRQNWEHDCQKCSHPCSGTYKDWEECYSSRKYSTITEYLCEELGASTEKNVCALLTDLAKYNKMKMSELMRKYEGKIYNK